MNQRTYEQLKRQFAAERQARIDAAEADYKNDIEALERIWSRLHGGQVSTSTAMPIADKVAPSRLTKGRETSARSAIRRAIGRQSGDFTANQIIELVQTELPDVGRRTVTDALFRMTQDGEIEAVVVGKGRRAAVYRAPGQNRQGIENEEVDAREALPLPM